MGEQYQLLDSYKICKYSGGLGPKQRQGDFKSPEGFYSVQRNQLKPDSRYYKAINIGFPNAYDRAHGYEGKYLMIHGDCVSIGCYAMTNQGIDEIFQFVTGALVFGQPSVQVSIYPFRMTDANMKRHKYSNFKDFWEQLKPGYDYFEQTRKPPTVSVVNGRYVVSKPLSTKLCSHNWHQTTRSPRQNKRHSPGIIFCQVSLPVSGCVAITVTTSFGVVCELKSISTS
ncbi:membrane protein [Escherichia coli]|uniref:Membrane protein n=1 Tax=Escherichia coli TaxID=562 RepID=A0A377F946_ECOLX|nr:membrane protein [Escherichia coli]